MFKDWWFNFLNKTEIKETTTTHPDGSEYKYYQAQVRDWLIFPVIPVWCAILGQVDFSNRVVELSDLKENTLQYEKWRIDQYLSKQKYKYETKEKVNYIKYP